jgi:hypothetical protein
MKEDVGALALFFSRDSRERILKMRGNVTVSL